MRLDKFLKVSRLIKRRAVAKEVADQGRVKINHVVAKSSSTVKIGDQLEVRFGNRLVTVEILDIQDTTKKQEATELYRILSEERIEREVPYSDEFLA